MSQILDREQTILRSLLTNQEYFMAAMPYMTEDLFEQKPNKVLFKCVKAYHEKYNRQANEAVVSVFVNSVRGLTDTEHEALQEITPKLLNPDTSLDVKWMLDDTVEWIRQRLYFLTLFEAAEGIDKGKVDGSISEKLEKALSVTFDSEIGHDYFDSGESRFDSYIEDEYRFPFDLSMMNRITRGGVTKGTLNILLSSDTGGFKSGTMCHMATADIKQGRNVLYLTFEMSEAKIAERIDANMMDVEIDNLPSLGRDTYLSRLSGLKSKFNGRLVIKQFPTSMCHVGHIRYFLNELRLKKRFVPDTIYLDYLNLMASMRLKGGDAGNSYGYIKAIAEEVRGLAIEQDVPVWTGTQSNRDGVGNSELSLKEISESYGTAHTADLILGIITTPEYDAANKILFKQLKNRYSDKNSNPKFFLGVNKAKMRLFDLPSNAQAAPIITGQDNQSAVQDTGLNLPGRGRRPVGDGFVFGGQ